MCSLFSCFPCCRSAPLLPSDAPRVLKEETYKLASSLRRQLDNINREQRSKTPVKRLVKKAESCLKPITRTQNKVKTIYWEKVGSLSTSQLRFLSEQIISIRDGLVLENCVLRAAPSAIDSLFDQMRSWSRQIADLQAFYLSKADDLKDESKKVEIRNFIDLCQDKLALAQDAKGFVSRALVANFEESRVEELLEFIQTSYANIRSFSGELNGASTVVNRPARHTLISSRTFDAPTTASLTSHTASALFTRSNATALALTPAPAPNVTLTVTEAAVATMNSVSDLTEQSDLTVSSFPACLRSQISGPTRGGGKYAERKQRTFSAPNWSFGGDEIETADLLNPSTITQDRHNSLTSAASTSMTLAASAMEGIGVMPVVESSSSTRSTQDKYVVRTLSPARSGTPLFLAMPSSLPPSSSMPLADSSPVLPPALSLVPPPSSSSVNEDSGEASSDGNGSGSQIDL